MSEKEPPTVEYAPNTLPAMGSQLRGFALSIAVALVLGDLARVAIIIFKPALSSDPAELALMLTMLLGFSSLAEMVVSMLGALIAWKGKLRSYLRFFVVHAIVDFSIFIVLELGGRQLWGV